MESNCFAGGNPSLFRKVSSPVENNVLTRNDEFGHCIMQERTRSRSRDLNDDQRHSMTTVDIAVKGKSSGGFSRRRQRSMSQEWIVLTMTTTDEETLLIPSSANKEYLQSTHRVLSDSLREQSDSHRVQSDSRRVQGDSHRVLSDSHSPIKTDSLTHNNSQEPAECFEDACNSFETRASYESIFSDDLNSTAKLEYKHFLKMQQDTMNQRESNVQNSEQENKIIKMHQDDNKTLKDGRTNFNSFNSAERNNSSCKTFTNEYNQITQNSNSHQCENYGSNSNTNILLNSKININSDTCDFSETASSPDVSENSLDITPINVRQGIAKWEALSHNNNKRDFSRTERRSASTSLTTATEKNDAENTSEDPSVRQRTIQTNNKETRVLEKDVNKRASVLDNDVITKTCDLDNDFITKTRVLENEFITKTCDPDNDFITETCDLDNDVADIPLTAKDINEQIAYLSETSKIITKQVKSKSIDVFKIQTKCEEKFKEEKLNYIQEKQLLKNDLNIAHQISWSSSDDVFQDDKLEQYSDEKILPEINKEEKCIAHEINQLELPKMVCQKIPLGSVVDEERDNLPVPAKRVSRVNITFKLPSEQAPLSSLSFSEIIIPAKPVSLHTLHTTLSYKCTQLKEIELVPGGRPTTFKTQLDLPSRFMWTSLDIKDTPMLVRSSIEVPARPVSAEFVLEVPEVRTLLVSTYEFPASYKLVDLNAPVTKPTAAVKPTNYSVSLNVVLLKSKHTDDNHQFLQLSMNECNKLKFSEFVDYDLDEGFIEESAVAFSDTDNLWMRSNDILIGFATLQPVEQVSCLSYAKKTVMTSREPVFDSSININPELGEDALGEFSNTTLLYSANSDPRNTSTSDGFDSRTPCPKKLCTANRMSELVTINKKDCQLVNEYETSCKLDGVHLTDSMYSSSAEIADNEDTTAQAKPLAFGVETILKNECLNVAPEFLESKSNIETGILNSERSILLDYTAIKQQHEQIFAVTEEIMKPFEKQLSKNYIENICESIMDVIASNEHKISEIVCKSDAPVSDFISVDTEINSYIEGEKCNILKNDPTLNKTDISFCDENNAPSNNCSRVDANNFAIKSGSAVSVADDDSVFLDSFTEFNQISDLNKSKTLEMNNSVLFFISETNDSGFKQVYTGTGLIEKQESNAIPCSADGDGLPLTMSLSQPSNNNTFGSFPVCNANHEVLQLIEHKDVPTIKNNNIYENNFSLPESSRTPEMGTSEKNWEEIYSNRIFETEATRRTAFETLKNISKTSPSLSDISQQKSVIESESKNILAFPQFSVETSSISKLHNKFNLPESIKTSETETTDESWEEMYSEHTVETWASRMTSNETKEMTASNSNANPSLSDISQQKSFDFETSANELIVPQLSIETPSVSKLNKIGTCRKTSTEDDDEWSSSKTVIHKRYLFDQSIDATDRAENSRKEFGLLDESIQLETPPQRDINKTQRIDDDSSSYSEDSSSYSRSVVITSTRNLTSIAGRSESDVIVHQYAEMFSFFTQPPFSASDAVLRSLLLRHQNNYAIRRLLAEYPALRPSTWAWSTSQEIDSCSRPEAKAGQTDPSAYNRSRVGNKNNGGRDEIDTKSLEIPSNRGDHVTQECSIKFEPLIERFTLVDCKAVETLIIK